MLKITLSAQASALFLFLSLGLIIIFIFIFAAWLAKKDEKKERRKMIEYLRRRELNERGFVRLDSALGIAGTAAILLMLAGGLMKLLGKITALLLQPHPPFWLVSLVGLAVTALVLGAFNSRLWGRFMERPKSKAQAKSDIHKESS